MAQGTVTPVASPQRSPLSAIGLVAIGGAAGSAVRYELAVARPVASGHFPWATLTANAAGALLLGILLALLVDAWRPTRFLRPLAVVGFCGGLTTFSTWMVESALLVRDGDTATALAYLMTSLVVGVVAAAVGLLGTRRLLHRREPWRFDPAGED
jgi:fluoride exporter